MKEDCIIMQFYKTGHYNELTDEERIRLCELIESEARQNGIE